MFFFDLGFSSQNYSLLILIKVFSFLFIINKLEAEESSNKKGFNFK
jgi:hypothetical protein